MRKEDFPLRIKIMVYAFLILICLSPAVFLSTIAAYGVVAGTQITALWLFIAGIIWVVGYFEGSRLAREIEIPVIEDAGQDLRLKEDERNRDSSET